MGSILRWEKGHSTATLPNNGQEKNNFCIEGVRHSRILVNVCWEIQTAGLFPACILVTRFLIQVACMKAVFSLFYAVAPIAIALITVFDAILTSRQTCLK